MGLEMGIKKYWYGITPFPLLPLPPFPFPPFPLCLPVLGVSLHKIKQVSL